MDGLRIGFNEQNASESSSSLFSPFALFMHAHILLNKKQLKWEIFLNMKILALNNAS